MNNKKIIFGILLFLAISFLAFTFANPDEEKANGDGSGVKIQNGGNSQNSNGETDGTVVSSIVIANGVKTNIKIGETTSLNPTVIPSTALDKKLTFTSSNPSVITVDENGVVTGVGKGTATITITSSNGKKKDIVIVVTEDDTAIADRNPNNSNNNNYNNNNNNSNNNGGGSNNSGSNGGNNNTPAVPDPIVPDPVPTPPEEEKKPIEANFSSEDGIIVSGSGHNIKLNGDLKISEYENKGETTFVYKIGLHISAPVDAKIGTVTYIYEPNMGIGGVTRNPVVVNGTFSSTLIIPVISYKKDAVMKINIDWGDGNGPSLYTIDLSGLNPEVL